MFRIGEFSKLTQISIRMLRYYDEMGLLKPAYIQEETGYRLYTTKQIKEMNRIIFLRDAGFNVGEIKKLLAHWTPEGILGALNDKAEEVRVHIAREKERLGKIETALEELGGEKKTVNDQVTIKSVPSYQVFSLRKHVENYFCEGKLWGELCEEVGRRKLNLSEKAFSFTIYHPQEEEAQCVDMEVCVQWDGRAYEPIKDYDRGQGQLELDEGYFCFREVKGLERVASVMVYGPFERVNGVYEEVARWLEEHGQYQMLGESRQISHKGPANETDEEKYVTELQIALKLRE